ncbi:hypothetical protein ASE04_10220 [Rhizobium sp. Root708]|nr:hypothetical protein ASE04_10220 [Rhizobium sp. Root708]
MVISSLLSSVASRDRKFTTSDIGVISIFNVIAVNWRRTHGYGSERPDVDMRTDELSLEMSGDITSTVRCLDFGAVPA